VRALLSVANREGIAAFARELVELGVEIYATDGTREHLATEGVEVGAVVGLDVDEGVADADAGIFKSLVGDRVAGEEAGRLECSHQLVGARAVGEGELDLVADLGATDEQGLTGTGRSLAALPLPPRIGRLLVEAARLGCLDRAAIAAAIASWSWPSHSWTCQPAQAKRTM